LPAQGFEFDAVKGLTAYGADPAGGYPISTGEYRYRDGKFLYNAWTNNKFVTSSSYFSGTNFNNDHTRHPDGHSKIIGFMFDGYPIYGPFGYTNPLDNTEGITQQLSSYRLKLIESTGRGYTYTQEPAGTFIQDYEFVQDLGTLDEYNGKYTKTPDYPNGTYAYFLTFVDGELSITTYPYIAGIQTKEQRLTNVSTPPPSQGSTYTVNVTNNGSTSYQLNGVDKNGVVNGPNATVTMNTGDTINFSVNVTGHPFYIKLSQTTGTGGLVTNPPVTGQGTQVGTVSWTPTIAGTYYYVCQFHGTMVGQIIVQ
jgi:plastocyanin